MNQDLSIFALVAQASLIVQLVMASLLIVSVASWSVIVSKLIALSKVRTANDAFETEFWSGKTSMISTRA
jgi:biopolymer transport protein TolQ